MTCSSEATSDCRQISRHLLGVLPAEVDVVAAAPLDSLAFLIFPETTLSWLPPSSDPAFFDHFGSSPKSGRLVLLWVASEFPPLPSFPG